MSELLVPYYEDKLKEKEVIIKEKDAIIKELEDKVEHLETENRQIKASKSDEDLTNALAVIRKTFKSGKIDTDIIEEFLLQKYKNANIEDIKKIFLSACKSGNIDVVKCILKIEPKLDLAKPMIEACKSNSVEISKILIDHAVSNDNVTKLSNGPIATHSALHYACKNGKLEIVQLYLSNPNCLNIDFDEFRDMFNLACKSENVDICMELLTKIKTDKHGYRDIFQKACKYGIKPIVKHLIRTSQFGFTVFEFEEILKMENNGFLVQMIIRNPEIYVKSDFLPSDFRISKSQKDKFRYFNQWIMDSNNGLDMSIMFNHLCEKSYNMNLIKELLRLPEKSLKTETVTSMLQKLIRIENLRLFRVIIKHCNRDTPIISLEMVKESLAINKNFVIAIQDCYDMETMFPNEWSTLDKQIVHWEQDELELDEACKNGHFEVVKNYLEDFDKTDFRKFVRVHGKILLASAKSGDIATDIMKFVMNRSGLPSTFTGYN